MRVSREQAAKNRERILEAASRLMRERGISGVGVDALTEAAGLVRRGERRADVMRAAMARTIGAEPLATLGYVAVVDDETWEDLAEIAGPARALVAASLGGTRLIDNLAVPSVQNTRRAEERI